MKAAQRRRPPEGSNGSTTTGFGQFGTAIFAIIESFLVVLLSLWLLLVVLLLLLWRFYRRDN